MDNEQIIKSASRCTCRAITVTIDGVNYSMSRAFFNKLFVAYRRKITEIPTNGCDYCVNHWGIDLCACGSGKKYWKCKEGYKVCGRPMQSIEKGYNKIIAIDSPLRLIGNHKSPF